MNNISNIKNGRYIRAMADFNKIYDSTINDSVKDIAKDASKSTERPTQVLYDDQELNTENKHQQLKHQKVESETIMQVGGRSEKDQAWHHD